jgi:hypothetical protein
MGQRNKGLTTLPNPTRNPRQKLVIPRNPFLPLWPLARMRVPHQFSRIEIRCVLSAGAARPSKCGISLLSSCNCKIKALFYFFLRILKRTRLIRCSKSVPQNSCQNWHEYNLAGVMDKLKGLRKAFISMLNFEVVRGRLRKTIIRGVRGLVSREASSIPSHIWRVRLKWHRFLRHSGINLLSASHLKQYHLILPILPLSKRPTNKSVRKIGQFSLPPA